MTTTTTAGTPTGVLPRPVAVNVGGELLGTGRAPGGRRWLRLLIPLLVGLAAIVATLVVHAIEQPSPGDRDYLNPSSTAGVGAATLAGQLTGNGRRITTVHTGAEALDLAAGGDTTLFLPAADFLRPDLRARIARLAVSDTVVLVRPSLTILTSIGLGFLDKQTRWATRSAQGCAGQAVNPTGPALVYRDHYQPYQHAQPYSGLTVTRDCFEHALQGWRAPGGPEVVLVGADDIFRNDRIGELGNADLAGSLLGGHTRLVWLDLHRREPLPRAPKPEQQNSDHEPAPQPDEDSSLPVPDWVKASAAGLAVAALIAALAAARRLGPPVEEPLPVRPRATETALGRGRLYRRARARQAALDALRGSALTRLRGALNVPPDAPPGDLVTAVSERTGASTGYVQTVLHGPEPEDDEQLALAVAALDALVEQALPTPTDHPTTQYDLFTKEGP
jgi:hypothetical protein